MKIYIVLISLVLFIATACSKGNSMEKVDSLWLSVSSSKDSQQEEAAIENIWKFIADEGMSIAVYSFDAEGKEVDINDTPVDTPLKQVKIVFSKGGDSKSIVWNPVDQENIFILFRE